MPSLAPRGATPEAEALRENLRLQLDGRTVWAQEVPFFESPDSKAYFGENGIGASTCEAVFGDGLARTLRLPLNDSFHPNATGPLRLDLRLPRGRSGRREPLVVTGVTGHADLLSIVYVDDSHIRFALDHWGSSLTESEPVSIDYGPLHRLEIRLPTFDWPLPADGGNFTGEIDILIDNVIVWRRTTAFYREPPDTLEIGANQIGGSSCEAAFSGGILSLNRPNDMQPAHPNTTDRDF